MDEAKTLSVHEGGFYRSRGGKIYGPLEPVQVSTPTSGGSARIWEWCVKTAEGWLHWELDGKWFQSPGMISSNDLMEEVAAAQIASGAEWPTEQDAKHWSREELDELLAKATKPPEGMTKKRLLELAIEATADRGLNYGKPEDNFGRIAAHWTVYLRNRILSTAGPEYISATDVAMMCALLKIARLENDPRHKDSWVDLAGYAACGAEIALAQAPEKPLEAKTQFGSLHLKHGEK